MTSRLMVSLCVAATAAFAAPAFAQGTAAPAAPAAPAPSTMAKPAAPHAMAGKSMHHSSGMSSHHPAHMARATRGSGASQDAAVDRLNQMSLQSAQSGQAFMPTASTGAAPANGGKVGGSMAAPGTATMGKSGSK